MAIKFTNNAFGTLAVSILSTDTAISLTAGQGARFPALAAGDWFYADLVDASGNLELIKVTARATDALTVLRGVDGTSARAYAAGDRLELRLCNAAMQDIINPITQPVTGGTVTANAPVLDATQTWNNAGVTFTAVRANITDSASNAASLLADLQVGGVSKFSVDKTGLVVLGSALPIASGGTASTNASAARTALGLAIGTNVEAWDADLDALAALAGTGIAARTAANTWAQRTIAAGTGVSVTNGDGVAGNPSVALSANALTCAITYVIDGGGAVPTTGVKGDLVVPFACTINSVTVQADVSGSAVVDIWKKTYTLDSPPTVANTITASALPTLASHQSSQDATLTGWTTAISANDMLRYNLNSVTTCTRLSITLKVTKT